MSFHRFITKIKLNKSLRFYSSSNKLESVSFSNGRTLKLSTGELAKLADGCVLGNSGDTSVMVTVVSKANPSQSHIVPLTVDYQEKFAAAGRIPTNHLRREFKSTDREILVSRCIDRSLRPLFNENFNFETQIVCDTLEIDGVNDPDVVSINAASAALTISDIPWNGPIGAVRVGFIDNETIINPTRRELELSSLNLVVTAAKQNLVVMLEGSANNILQQDLLKAIKVGVKEAQFVISGIEKLQKEIGKTKRALVPPVELSCEIAEAIESLSTIRVREIFRNFTYDKINRDIAITTLKADVLKKINVDFVNFDCHLAEKQFDKVSKKVFRDLIFEDDKRCDGRDLDDLRKISCKIDMYRSLHGCALFQRGQTQVDCTVTLDSSESALKLDPVAVLKSGIKKKNFFVHYVFPPYATKEIGKIGFSGRREIGHGALAEKGLFPIVPHDYPFTIQLNSKVLESNGSSSMATVCGGTLALMDAGVPITAPAAGVAIGLVSRCSNNDSKHIEDYRLLTDLLGIEDYLGDMDFKLAGTRKGINALQADIKLPGLPLKIVMEAIQKATVAKTKILDIMNECIDQPRTERKEKWPVVEKLEVEAHKRSRLFGAGGSNLKNLYYETGVHVTQLDDNKFSIFAPNQQAMDEAKDMITNLLKSDPTIELEYGQVYNAKVVEVRDIGVMIVLAPNMQPVLLKNSQLDQTPIAHPSAAGIDVGQEIKVKYFGRDPKSGHMRLSRKVLQMTARYT